MQPISYPQWQRISGTASGTTNVTVNPSALYRVYVPANRTGTASFYDHSAGTAGTSFMFDLANTTGTIPTSIEIGVRLRNGLTVVTGGTTDFLVAYE